MDSRIRYFRSQCFVQEDELTEAAAVAEGHYVRAYFEGDRAVRAEIVRPPGEIEIVAYYDREWPDESLALFHRERYPELPARVSTQRRPLEGGESEVIRTDLSADLEVLGWTREVLEPDGGIRLEERFDAAGCFLDGYRYQWTGEDLERVWLIIAEGEEILEWEADDR